MLMLPVRSTVKVPVLKSKDPLSDPKPVVSLNRPVPPVTCHWPVPWYCPGPVGHATSSLVTVRVSPLAAVRTSTLTLASPPAQLSPEPLMLAWPSLVMRPICVAAPAPEKAVVPGPVTAALPEKRALKGIGRPAADAEARTQSERCDSEKCHREMKGLGHGRVLREFRFAFLDVRLGWSSLDSFSCSRSSVHCQGRDRACAPRTAARHSLGHQGHVDICSRYSRSVHRAIAPSLARRRLPSADMG